MAVIHRRGRPVDGFGRTRDAVALFNALKRHGYTWDRAAELANAVSGVPRRNIERYAADRTLLPTDDRTADDLARCALIKRRAWHGALRAQCNAQPDRYPLPVTLLQRDRSELIPGACPDPMEPNAGLPTCTEPDIDAQP